MWMNVMSKKSDADEKGRNVIRIFESWPHDLMHEIRSYIASLYIP